MKQRNNDIFVFYFVITQIDVQLKIKCSYRSDEQIPKQYLLSALVHVCNGTNAY